MQRHKPVKLDARHFKNTFITSRNQALTASLQQEELNATSSFLHSTPTSLHPPSHNHSRADTTGGKSSTDPKAPSSGQQRLKLKDYMHLNGIEKRSRSKNNSIRSQRIKTEESFGSKEAPTPKNGNLPQRPKVNSVLQASFQSNTHRRSAQEHNSQMVKQEILARIKEERKRLTDLESFLEADFQCKPDMSQTFLFLFALYNKMTEINKINTQVGERIILYSKKEEEGIQKSTSLRTPKIKRENSYHWEQQRKELDSPAKIMNRALKMTFDLAQLLNIKQ